MIRKKVTTFVLSVLTILSGTHLAEAQEIRLEPPQLDRQRIVSRARPAGQTTRMRQSMTPGARAPRMGVSRVARQEAIRMSRPRGVFQMAALQGDDTGANPNNTAPNTQGNPIVQDPIIEDEMIFDDGMIIDDGAFFEEPVGPAYPTYQLVSFADMEYFVGVQGFKGVPNLGESGSFGFNEGINWGFPMPILPLLSLSGQVGARFTQSDFYGANLTADSHSQTFLTGGISRRVDYGFQMGVAVDYLNDNWYYDGSFVQLRSEIGFVGGYGNLFGFRACNGLQDDAPGVSAGLASIGFGAITNFEPIDTYRFFYRQQWDQVRGGHIEASGGFTENGDGLFGAEFMIPIAERWALTSNVNCLLPSTSVTSLAQIDESWNVGMGLTWYPKGLSTWSRLYHRPLFNVADNGSFMFKR